jgi:hypothetical protein
MIMFNSLLVIGGVAIAVPLLLGLVPAVKVPAVVWRSSAVSWSGLLFWGGCISMRLSG